MAEEQANVAPQQPAATPAPEAPAVTLGQAEQAQPQAASRPAPPLPEGKKFIWGTGRRKTAIARVRIKPGSGEFTVNAKPFDKFFVDDRDRRSVLAPLAAANMVKSWDVIVRVTGGGSTGQAGATSLGLARALMLAFPEVEASLRDQGLLTRDARMKERKKYGQKGARKRFQFSKR